MSVGDQRNAEPPDNVQFRRVAANLAIWSLELGQLADRDKLHAPDPAWSDVEFAHTRLGVLLAHRKDDDVKRRDHEPLQPPSPQMIRPGTPWSRKET